MDPRAEALLYAAARAQLVRERLRPLLGAGVLVLLDRFVDSSLAYQGAGRELGIEPVRAINRFATDSLAPDRTLLLRIAPADGRARQDTRASTPDRLEREDDPFFARIAAAYDELALAEPERFRVLDASLAPHPRPRRRTVRDRGPTMSFAVFRLLLAATTLTLALVLPAPVLSATPATTPTFPTPASARIPPAASTTTAPRTTTAPTTATTTPAATPTVPPTTFTTPGSSAVSPLNRAAANARLRAGAHSSGSGHVSTEAIVLAAIAALLLLACAAWAFARSRAYEPHWLVSVRHAMAEAGFRTSATWAEFTDWARIGR